MTLSDAVAHLSPERWDQADRLLIRKALAEFAHERLITPEQDGESYVVRSDDGLTSYRFSADRRALDHWQVDAASITRHRDGAELPLAALDFFIELQKSLGLSDEILPVYLEEISSTLSGTCYKLTKPKITAAELARGDFQAIETGMTEGHPCFVANNGRLGFGIHEYLSYAPETASPVRLVWLAAHRSRAAFTAGVGIEYESFLREELGERTVERFHGVLREAGLDPADYLFIPVHPWQWWNKLTVTFAAEVARKHLVCLGEGDDEYLAQQSIRTFFNKTSPEKHYVKTALSVLNMGFMRGLSAAYMEATPAINDWLAQLIEGDPVLRSTGLSIIRERAAVGYRHLEYEQATDRYSPYRKMLAALWRESPVPSLQEGESLATMASLVHVDHEGASFAGALIEQSGLAPKEWLRHYLRAYFTPAPAQLLRLRPGVHAARRERHPRPEGRGRAARDLQGHRRGDRRHGPGRGAAAGGRAAARGGPGGQEAPVASSRTSSTASSASSPRTSPPRASWRRTTSGARSRRSPATTRSRCPNSPTSSSSTTCSPPSSPSPASTASSCATTSRWWTSRTRPAPSSWSAP